MACAARSPCATWSAACCPVEELVISNGALEALNLCLQVVTRPGDLVAIEAPAFYATPAGAGTVEAEGGGNPVHPREGIDLEVLADSLERLPIKACWFMSNFQNPMGASMDDEKKRALAELLARHQVPMIEDDVYAELYFGQQAPKPVKAYDQEGLVMHCSSFSKSLAPGYRVGWVAGGRYAEQIERLKLMTSLSASIPAQAAIADYLQHGGYDRHLRKLRYALETQQNAMLAAVARYFPEQTRSAVPAAATSSGWSCPGGRLAAPVPTGPPRASASPRGRSSPPPAASPIAPGSTTGTRGARGRRRRWRPSGGSPSRWRDDARTRKATPGRADNRAVIRHDRLASPIPVCAAALHERLPLPHLIPKFHIDLKLFYPPPQPLDCRLGWRPRPPPSTAVAGCSFLSGLYR